MFPSGASTIIVTGTLPSPVSGTARRGRVVFTPSARLVDSTQKAIYSGGGPAILDSDGKFSVTLLCTDDTDVQPTGWRWHVDEQPSGGVRDGYWIDLPASLGPTVDLSVLAKVSAPDGTGGTTPTARPSGPAGGALAGTYPNPTLSSATIASFDPAGAASSAQTAAAADATTKANAAQTAATSAAASDATAKVTAHAGATDPHGDRAAATAALATHAADTSDVHGIPDTAALETQAGAQAKAASAQNAAITTAAADAAAKVSAHSADTTDVHGIADTAALETQTGAQAKASAAQTAATTAAATDATSKVAAHSAAADPHGDRAWADAKFALASTVTALNSYVDDTVNRIAAVENGTAWLSGLNINGNAQVVNGDLEVKDTAKGYRFRRGGSALDLEATGADLITSVWSGTGFNGTQHSYDRYSADALNVQHAGRREYVDALYGNIVHAIDTATGVAGLGAKNGLANLRLCGRTATAGAPTAGAWAAGDAVQDSAGAWWLCTASGSPGTWTGGTGGGTTIRSATARIVDGAVTDLPSAASWVIAETSVGTKLQCSIPATAGDRIRVEGDFMRSGAHFLDWVLLDNTGAIAVYGTSRSSTPPSEGAPSMYPSTSFPGTQGAKQFVVAAGHIASGQATIALAHQGTAAGRVYANSTYPFEMLLTNLGPEPA